MHTGAVCGIPLFVPLSDISQIRGGRFSPPPRPATWPSLLPPPRTQVVVPSLPPARSGVLLARSPALLAARPPSHVHRADLLRHSQHDRLALMPPTPLFVFAEVRFTRAAQRSKHTDIPFLYSLSAPLPPHTDIFSPPPPFLARPPPSASVITLVTARASGGTGRCAWSYYPLGHSSSSQELGDGPSCTALRLPYIFLRSRTICSCSSRFICVAAALSVCTRSRR